MTLDAIPPTIHEKFEIHEWKHAVAILKEDFPNEWKDLLDMLSALTIPKEWITTPGGNKSKLAHWVDSFLSQRGWCERSFQTAIKVDDLETDTPTHKIDCFKNGIALELEWNNKDPFFDRDLNNFRLLFDLRTVSVGIILTRCDELQDVLVSLGRDRGSYGQSTTHMSKLLPRIEGGGGAGCPLLVFGIRRCCIEEG